MTFAWGLLALGPLLIIFTIVALRTIADAGSSPIMRGIIFADFIYGILIVSLVITSITRVYIARKRNSAGSQLHMRLSGVFAIIALIPTVLVALFAALIINAGLEGWFSNRVRDVVGSSLAAAQAYETEQREDLQEDVALLARSLNELKRRQPFLEDSELRVALTQLQTNVQRGLKEAYVIDGGSELRARGEQSYLFGFEEPKPENLEAAIAGKTVVIEDWSNDEFRALVRLESFADRFLYVSREVDGEILSLLDDTKETVQFYNQMESERDRLLFDFSLIYLAFAAIITLSAIWIGLIFAERLARPVGRLAGAAQRLGRGDFDVRVVEERGDDEIAMLSRVFNTMTSQVKKQRDDLIAANIETERRRRLFDGVLSSVTAGVIGLSQDGRIRVMNSAAERLLNLDLARDMDREIDDAIPEFSELFHEVEDKTVSSKQRQISLTRAGTSEILLVRMAERREEGGEVEGYVVTFDDVSDLVSAQRMAAWGDVARRIAHEIKNPLTPIQLSAERVSRKFGPMLGDQSDDLKQYTDVIVRQTNDLRRIVDEFSKFARMPEPDKRNHDLTALVKDAVVLQKAALTDVHISMSNRAGTIWLDIDDTMIRQALTNLIKNAGEAIEAYQEKDIEDGFEPKIKVAMQMHDDAVEITIADNGIGLPAENRSRLFEPYVTHRDEGTGLGLSIVKKIIEEHGGTLELIDAQKFKGCRHTGALARIILPLGSNSTEHNQKADAKVA
ncbi:sensor histidine kinase NtrY-like [Paramylibacter kogurei]|nr:PAS domain-containing sensor histidine kinase [Amylibacter kogurei]